MKHKQLLQLQIELLQQKEKVMKVKMQDDLYYQYLTQYL